MKLKLADSTIDPCRIFCIGWNYADHVKELNNPHPSSPAIFMKPTTCLVSEGDTIAVPAHGEEFHWEVELVILIGKEGRVTDECLQLNGGAGYMDEYPISRMYANARISRIYAGSSEIMREIIARSLGLDPRKKSA